MIDIRIVYQDDWVQIFVNGDVVLEKRDPTSEDLAQALEVEGLIDLEVGWDRPDNLDTDDVDTDDVDTEDVDTEG